jgi:YhcH/YjgK/YiaL family protein
LGDYPLGDNGFHANVHSYQTLLEADCLWESHEHTIDVQYVIDGEEIIRWMPINALKGKSKSISAQDRLEWDAPLFNTTAITMRPGMFALFMPGEAHCPKIALGLPTLIKKAVFKVPIQLLKN